MSDIIENGVKAANADENLKRDWVIIGLIALTVVVAACNIALLTRHKFMQDRIHALQKDETERKNLMKEMGFREIARWQTEISAWREMEACLEAFSSRQYEKVVEYAQKAIDKYPQIPIAYYLKANAYIALQKEDEAVENLSAYLDAVPSSPYALWKRAIIYIHQNKKEKALEDLKQALDEKQDFAEAKKLLESLETGTKKDDKKN